MDITGQVLLTLALFGSVFSVFTGIFGAVGRRASMVQASIRATRAVFFFVAAAGMVLLYALVTHDYSNQYVAGYTSDSMPLFYLITSYWGGEKGALITWVTVLYTLLYFLTGRKYVRANPFWGYTMAIANFTGAFFFTIMLTASNPFEVFVTFPGPANGAGINPLLLNFFMVIHPPFQLAGFVAYVIPFSMAGAALLTRERFGHWERYGRRWMMFAWWSLSMGLLLGCLWSYMELGWGGFWGWDPVENAALLPWLIGTALLHLVFVDRGRGMFRRLSYFLVFLTYGMTVFATFLTRSQLIDSLHSFTQSKMTPYFLYFMLVVALFSLFLLAYGWRHLKPQHHVKHYLSLEVFVLSGVLIFLLLGFVVLWGTMLPKLTQSPAIRHAINSLSAGWAHLLGRPYLPLTSAMHVGAKWFNKVAAPFAFFVLLLAAIGPALRMGNRPYKSTVRMALWCAGIALALALVVAAITAWFIARIGGQSLTDVLKMAGSKQIWGFGILVVGLWILNFAVTDLFSRVWRLKKGLSMSFGRAAIHLARGNTRRFAAHFAHSLVALLAIGFFATTLGVNRDKLVLEPGRFVDVADHIFAFAGLSSHFSASESYATLTSHIVVMRKDQSVPTDALGIAGVHAEQVDEGPYLLLPGGQANKALWARLFAGSVAALDLRKGDVDRATHSITLLPRDLKALNVLPDIYSRWVSNLQSWASAMGNGEVRVIPGSARPVITLKFLHANVMDAFVKGLGGQHRALWVGPWQSRDLIVMLKGPGRVMEPEMRYYTFFDQPTSEVSIAPGVLYNVYVAASGAKGADLAGLTILVTPMANLIFLVNFLLLFLILLYWPHREARQEAAPATVVQHPDTAEAT